MWGYRVVEREKKSVYVHDVSLSLYTLIFPTPLASEQIMAPPSESGALSVF